MGLFDKKYCDVCGEKIGMFGNRKLEDANLCKKCAAKLSPWFSERRHSTLEDIKKQLAYREENKKDVERFHATRVIGRGYSNKLIIDEDNGKFMVGNPKKLSEENPDVIPFSDVTGVNLDIDEDRSEQYRTDKDGHSVSYNPPRYEYSYNFYLEVMVNHPYIDKMRFQLNDSSVRTGNRSINDAAPGFSGSSTAATVGNILGQMVSGMAQGMTQTGALPGTQTVWNAEYQEYLNMGTEAKNVLMGGRQAARDAAAAASAPKIKVTCPFCHATMIPDANGCCEYCGTALPR